MPFTNMIAKKWCMIIKYRDCGVFLDWGAGVMEDMTGQRPGTFLGGPGACSPEINLPSLGGKGLRKRDGQIHVHVSSVNLFQLRGSPLTSKIVWLMFSLFVNVFSDNHQYNIHVHYMSLTITTCVL